MEAVVITSWMLSGERGFEVALKMESKRRGKEWGPDSVDEQQCMFI